MDWLLLSWCSLSCTIVSDIILLNVDKHIHEGLLISPSMTKSRIEIVPVYKEKVYRKKRQLNSRWTKKTNKIQNVNSHYETLPLI
jgi:hypothetical protein